MEKLNYGSRAGAEWMSESQIFISDGAGGRGVKMMKNEIGYIWREGGVEWREGGREER